MNNLKKDNYGRTILTYYISDEKTEQAVSVIKNADIDFNQQDNEGYSYLHFATQMEQPVIVKALLERGAKVDVITRNGGTPLWIAVSRAKCYPIERSVEVIKLLLDAGADPNEITNGITLKKLANDTNIPEIIELICGKEHCDCCG